MDERVDLDELERMEREATEGPWAVVSVGEKGDGCDLIGAEVFHPDDEECETPVSGRVHDYMGEDGEWRQYERGEEVAVCEHRNRNSCGDSDLIVAMRNALPALIAELRELRRRCEDDGK